MTTTDQFVIPPAAMVEGAAEVLALYADSAEEGANTWHHPDPDQRRVIRHAFRTRARDALAAALYGCQVVEEHRRVSLANSGASRWYPVKGPDDDDPPTSIYRVEHRFVITTPAEEVATP